MAVLGLRRAYLRASTQQCRYTSSKAGSSFPDPFPLPLSSDVSHESSQDGLDESLLPPPIHRPNETITSLRARLVYQTRKRGTLESDLLLSTFAKENLPKMSEKELREFDKLLDEPDWDIYYWAIDKRQPPKRWEGTELLEKLRLHAKNEGKVVRRMPALDGWAASLSASRGSSRD
ncbi:Succinate dehydrogenase assembly factor 2 [Ceratobasidium theobromae]|uniref:Succinate dehydrogenase assembly factor 2, mitochondrial n=1 Tax=Ceratobasidium theobromae TaxID=1582974 RepID=A0A5N5QH43_9AGAM|nr:Succinate dehydrogenase assembly factor 2 [Ceratobasidium theobromae]